MLRPNARRAATALPRTGVAWGVPRKRGLLSLCGGSVAGNASSCISISDEGNSIGGEDMVVVSVEQPSCTIENEATRGRDSRVGNLECQ